MSNSEPSAIVLQGIPCMYGLYMYRFEWRKPAKRRRVYKSILTVCRRLLRTGRCEMDGRSGSGQEAPGPKKDVKKHDVGEFTGGSVLLAGMEGTDERRLTGSGAVLLVVTEDEV